MITSLSCDRTHCLSVIKASPLSTASPMLSLQQTTKNRYMASRPEPESPWLFLMVNTQLGAKGPHSDVDIVLKMSLLKDPAKSWSWATSMKENDGVSLVSALPSMLLGSLGRWTSFRGACPAGLLLGLSK